MIRSLIKKSPKGGAIIVEVYLSIVFDIISDVAGKACDREDDVLRDLLIT